MAEYYMVGDRLRVLRKRRKLTQQELAARVSRKIDYSYVGKIERGNQNPSIRTLHGIAHALKVPMGYFFAENARDRARYDVSSLLADRAKSEFMKEVVKMEREDVVFLAQVAKLLRIYRKRPKKR